MADPKPFEAAITIVKDIEVVVDALNSPDLQHTLTDLIDALEDVTIALTLVDDIDDAWGLLSSAWTAVDGAADTLTAFVEWIPVLDVVLDVIDAIDGTLNTIDDTVNGLLKDISETIDEILPIIRDIIKGLKEVQLLITSMKTELPSLHNTMLILQSMAEIVKAIEPLFEPLADKSTVGQKLKTLMNEYEAVDKAITKAATPLQTAFNDIKPVLNDMGKVLAEMRKITGGAFATIEKDFNWVATEVGKIEHDVKGAVEHLAPIRWVLDKVESVIKKVIKPVIGKISELLGLKELEKSIVGEIEKKLGFEALQQFQSMNTKDPNNKTTNVFGQNQSKTGSKKSAAMKDFWKDVGEALEDYKRGDKKSAVEHAVEALIDALTDGNVDLKAMPPVIPTSHNNYYLPKIKPLPIPPTQICLPQLIEPSRIQESKRNAALAMISLAQEMVADTPGDTKAFQALNSAISTVTASLQEAQTAAAPAQNVLAQIAPFTDTPQESRTELNALATIANSIQNTVAKLVSLYPDETRALAKWLPDGKQLSDRLIVLANQENNLANVLSSAPTQVATALTQVTPVRRIATHATALSSIAVGGGTVAQLLSMMDQLNESLDGAYSAQVQKVHQTIDANAQSEAISIATLQADSNGLVTALSAIRERGAAVLKFYQGIATWGIPVKEAWLPGLVDAATYANTIDSILAPLSYLLELGGCTKKKDASSAEDSIDIKGIAIAAAKALREGALIVLSDVLNALPEVLKVVTEDVLNLDHLEALLNDATKSFQDDIDGLTSSAKEVGKALSKIEAGTVPHRSYSWPIRREVKDKTIEILNVFIEQKQADSIHALVQEMLKQSVSQRLPFPDASPIIQSWRKTL